MACPFLEKFLFSSAKPLGKKMVHSKEAGGGLILSRYPYAWEPKGEAFMDSNRPDPLFSIALNIDDNVNTHKEIPGRGTRAWTESNQKTTPLAFSTLPAVGLIPNRKQQIH